MTTGTVACSRTVASRLCPPRGTSRSTYASAVSSSITAPRELSRISCTACSGTSSWPASTSVMMSAIAPFVAAATDEPRSTAALPDFRHSAATSTVTFGRASYTTATTPSGSRTCSMSRPLGRVVPLITWPTGSGSATTARTAFTMPPIRASVRVSRSTRVAETPAARAAATSAALAAFSRSRPASRASASWPRTASLALVFSSRVSAAAARACWQIRNTGVDTVSSLPRSAATDHVRASRRMYL